MTPVQVPPLVRMSQDQLDQLFRRLAVLLRPAREPVDMRDYTVIRETIVAVPSPDFLIVRGDVKRGWLAFSNDTSANMFLSTTTNQVNGQGLKLQAATNPVIFSLAADGPIVYHEWYAIAAPGGNLWVCEGLRA